MLLDCSYFFCQNRVLTLIEHTLIDHNACIHNRCSFPSKSATVITKGAKILWKWHIFKLRLLALYWTCLCETTTSNTKRTWIFWTGTNYFCLFSICGAKLKKLKGVESTLLQHLGLFLKAGGMNQKRKVLWPSPLVGDQNGPPDLGLCCLGLLRSIWNL